MDNKWKILIVDDEYKWREVMVNKLANFVYEGRGITYVEADSFISGKKEFDKKGNEDIAVAFIDVIMENDLSGLELADYINSLNESVQIVIITGQAGIDDNEEGIVNPIEIAIKHKINHFIEKGKLNKKVTRGTLAICLREYLKHQKLISENKHLQDIIKNNDEKTSFKTLRDEYKTKFKDELIWGKTSLKTFETISRVGRCKDIHVFISGESGSGKESLARLIYLSDKERQSKEFHAVNCAGFNDELFLVEMFGCIPGAYTNAPKNGIKGLFEINHNGILFLDEIADLSLSSQTKLLRALQTKKIRKVGGDEDIDADVRIISATNRNIEELISQKLFREDLFYRLSNYSIESFPLRERKDEISKLFDYYLEKICILNKISKPKSEDGIISELKEYFFPGNIRELCNMITHALINMPIENQYLTKELFINQFKDPENFEIIKDCSLEKAKERAFLKAWKKSGEVAGKTAKLLGVSVNHVTELIKRYVKK